MYAYAYPMPRYVHVPMLVVAGAVAGLVVSPTMELVPPHQPQQISASSGLLELTAKQRYHPTRMH